jgi:outer membrane immunogenic protein
MLRRILLATAGAVAFTGSAFAADLPSRAPPPVYIPPTPIFTWTGIYVGGQVGYAWGTQKANLSLPDGSTLYNSYNAEGVIGGGHVGYNYQVNQWVVGIEGSVDGTSLSKTFVPSGDGVFVNGVGFVPGAGSSYTASSPVQGSIRGRVGIAWDRALIYATGGAAFGGITASVSTPFGYASRSTTRVGWTVGGGIEYAVTNNWSVRAEYRYTDFGSFTNYPAVFAAPVAVSRHFTQNQVQVGFSYKFDTYAPAPVVAKY